MKTFFSALFVISVVLAFSSCSKKDEVVPAIPLIGSISPQSGTVDTEVTITGENFGGTVADNEVRFNGKIATILSASASQIIARVPLAAGTGPVTVATETATATGPLFSYEEPIPSILSFAPESGPHGTTVQINGSNFGNSIASNIIKFNNVTAEVISASATQITAKVPVGARDGKITVTVNGQTGASSNNFTYNFTVVVSSLAGGAQGNSDGTGASAQFNFPANIVLHSSGDLLVTDRANHRIRRVTPAGVVSTYAGSSAGSTDGDLSIATFISPNGLVYDGSGNLYVIELTRIRKITPAGVVSTLAGSATSGFVDANGSSARFGFATMGVFDGQGDLLVVDLLNHRVRKVTPAGEVTTFVGSGSVGATDGTGTAASFDSPWGIVKDSQGSFFVSEQTGSKIRKITPAGVVTTFAGGTSGFADGIGTAAQFGTCFGMAINSQDEIFVASAARIRKISPAAQVTTVAGLSAPGFVNGSANLAQFSAPYCIAIAGDGSLYIGERNNYGIRKISFE